MDSNTIADDPSYRIKLREERRIRNKLKRQQKKANKLKSDENKKIIVNANIAIVSPGFVEEYRSKLDERQDSKIAKKHPLVINLSERLECASASSPPVKKPEKISAKDVVLPVGNRLDSAQPVRQVGKHREVQKDKRQSKLKRDLISSHGNSDYDNTADIDYCNNVITEDLENQCELFLKEIVELQEKLYKRDPRKGSIKRKYVVGFNEAKKYIVVKKLKLLIIAKDIRIKHVHDPLDRTVKELIELADRYSVPYVFALKRRKIGKVTLKFILVSCVGIKDYDGANEQFKTVMKEILMVKSSENENQLKSAEVTESLIQKLRDTLVVESPTT